jgi:transcriptional accessory protein Tex/SPT6
MLNKYLQMAGHAERVNHRSFERQGITDQIPTIHLGVAAHQMEKRGIRTDRGNINREIEVSNNLLRQINARISKLQKWIDEESKIDEPPTLADVIPEILNRRNKDGQSSRYQAINNLQTAAQMLNFLTENNIMNLTDLEIKLKSMYNRQSAIREKLKPKDRRMKDLNKRIKQADYYFEFRNIYKMYKAEKPKHQEQFYEQHRRELTLYEAADRYLKNVMNGRTQIPTATWKKERATLIAERKQLNAEYLSLKDEVSKVEKIVHSVQNILHEERRREQPTHRRTQVMER